MTKFDEKHDKNFFILVDPRQTIKDLLVYYQKYYHEIMNSPRNNAEVIKDTYDGHLYKEFRESLADEDKKSFCTLVFNTEGAQAFERSTFAERAFYLGSMKSRSTRG